MTAIRGKRSALPTGNSSITKRERPIDSIRPIPAGATDGLAGKRGRAPKIDYSERSRIHQNVRKHHSPRLRADPYCERFNSDSLA